MYCLLKVKINLTSFEFSQCWSHTDFGIKLDGYRLLTNYEVKQILIWSKRGHWRHNRVKSFRILGFLVTKRNFQAKFYRIVFRKFFTFFYNRISTNCSLPLSFLEKFIKNEEQQNTTNHNSILKIKYHAHFVASTVRDLSTTVTRKYVWPKTYFR